MDDSVPLFALQPLWAVMVPDGRKEDAGAQQRMQDDAAPILVLILPRPGRGSYALVPKTSNLG